MAQPLLNQQRFGLLVLLFTLLASVYLISYSARTESTDTRRYFDAVSSFADYGDFALDLSAWQFPPFSFDKTNSLPLQSADVEPLQVILAAPLYLIAQAVPGIGLLQTVYLFNVLVGAAAGCVLFLYALALGYTERTALLVALAFGVGTVILPYSKTFFREPLVLLVLLTCGLLIERLRTGGYRSLPLFAAVFLALIALLLAKASALLAFPALVVIALPEVGNARWRRVLAVMVIVVGLIVGLFLVLGFTGILTGAGSRYNVMRLFSDDASSYLVTALQAYLLSVGGSFWGTSPVLLLALPGMVLLVRQRQGRYPLAILLLVGAFAFGYAALNGPHWFGGLSWPPRFLIPVVPFVMLGALPIFERMRRQRGWAIVGALLLVYGVWIQISGATLAWTVYPDALPPEAHGLLEWGGGLNDLRYLRWVIVPTLWGTIPLDIAWSVIKLPGVMIALGALALAAGMGLVRRLRFRLDSVVSRRAVLVVLPLLLIVVTGYGLHAVYSDDPRALSEDNTLYAMLPILETETDAGDVILLSSPRYEPFFANSGKLHDAGRVIALPLQYGEQPSPEEEPLIRSQNPDVLLTKETNQLIINLALTHERLWLLVDGGPDLWWSVRPVERFMSSHYYVLRVIETGVSTRLIEYSTISAPDAIAYREPEHLTDLAFGDHIRLAGLDILMGVTYHAGDVLALSLYWTTDVPLAAHDTVGLYLRDANGAPIAQVDEEPGNGFFPTSGWQVGVPVRDNHAMRLADDLPPGNYQLWIKLYDFAPDGSVDDLPVTAGEHVDDSIGILPVTIHVE